MSSEIFNLFTLPVSFPLPLRFDASGVVSSSVVWFARESASKIGLHLVAPKRLNENGIHVAFDVLERRRRPPYPMSGVLPLPWSKFRDSSTSSGPESLWISSRNSTGEAAIQHFEIV